MPYHWFIVGELIRRTGARVHLPSYRLAPQHTIDDALPPLVELLAGLPRKGRGLVLAGDSAGGGLALALSIALRDNIFEDDALPAPADQLLLFAPWVDVRCTNPEAARMEAAGEDMVLRRDGSRAAGRWWAGSRGVDDPLVSPVLDHLEHLPPMAVYQGGADILRPDVEILVEKARDAGGKVAHLHEPTGFHVYVADPTSAASRRAYTHAAARIRAAGRKHNPRPPERAQEIATGPPETRNTPVLHAMRHE